MERSVAYAPPLGLFVEARFREGAFVEVRLLRAAEPTAAHPLLDALLAHLERGAGPLADLPVALDVPAFHAEVLAEVRRIPRGRTATYGELARKLGRPGAARAVGGACAANPAPLAVPCHRVVGADGGLVSYSGEGGIATKRRLLEIEGAILRQARL